MLVKELIAMLKDCDGNKTVKISILNDYGVVEDREVSKVVDVGKNVYLADEYIDWE